MWGNKEGWLISAVIAAVMAFLLYLAASPGSPTPPTGTLTLAFQPAAVPVDPNTVLPAPDKDCDAGALYRQAAQEYTSHQDQYEKYMTKVKEARDADPAAVKFLLDAADCGKMHLFDKNPEELVTYDSDRPALSALNGVGTICNQFALLYAAEGNAEQSQKYARAAFNLGRHLYEERIVFEEWTDGITLMESAADVLDRTEKDPARVEAIKTFMVESNAFRRDKIKPLWQIINGMDPAEIAKYSGDIMLMARKENPERMWRVEGIFKLGRYKYDAATRGDQFGAKRELAELAKSENDPIVRTAASAAHNLTIEDYRILK